MNRRVELFIGVAAKLRKTHLFYLEKVAKDSSLQLRSKGTRSLTVAALMRGVLIDESSVDRVQPMQVKAQTGFEYPAAASPGLRQVL